MKGTQVRALLEQLEHEAVPEPDAAFVARLEAQLRTMDQLPETEPAGRRRGVGSRPGRRARWIAAAAPVAALTAAAAAAAVTLLPSEPKPRDVRTADPSPAVTAPAPESPLTTEPTPTTVAPWAPRSTDAPPVTTSTPKTAAPKRINTAPVPGPTDNSPATTAVTSPRSTETTLAKPAPTTTTVPPAPGPMTLSCMTGITGGSGVIRCEWSQNTSPQFRWYRLWRESSGSPPAVVSQSDTRATTVYYDMQVQVGTAYYYKADVIDGSGNVIAQSNVVPVTCC